MNTAVKYLSIIVLILGISACNNSSSNPSPQLSFTKAVDYQEPLTIIGGELNYNLLRTMNSSDTLYGVKFNPYDNTIVTYGDSSTLHIYSMNLEPIQNLQSKNDEILAIDISSDGQYLASAGDDGYIEIWDLKSYKLIHRMQNNSDDIFAVAFNSDHSQLASAGEEKVIDIWNVNSGEQIARLEGHEESIQDINFIDFNRKIVSTGKDNQTKIWNVLQKKLIYSYLTPSNKYGEIKKSKSFDDYTISALTEVESSEGNSRKRNGPPMWIYTMKFKDNQGNTLTEFDQHRGPITDIDISNNKSYMASSSEDRTIRLWDLEKKKHITNIILKDKVNAVSINKSGYLLVALEGEKNLKLFQIKSTYESAQTSTPPTNKLSKHGDAWYKNQYAIVIGIDHYKRLSLPRLNNAVTDARSVAELLKKKGFSLIELYNENATKEKILDALKKIKQKSTSKDATLFYFAGHGDGVSGHKNVREGYILPFDFNSDLNNPSTDVMYYDKSALSISSLVMYSRDTPAKHVGIILDSCFSGLAMESKYAKKSLYNHKSKNLNNIEYDAKSRSVRIKPTTVNSTDESTEITNLFRELLEKKSINILTAGDDQPVSDGSGHSPFTQAFLDVLNAQSNDKGYIGFTTLADYIKKYVEDKTRQRQKPQYKNESLENGEFLFQL